MSPESLRQAAELLAAARRDVPSTIVLPEDVRPQTADEGYAIQDLVHDLNQQAGSAPIGLLKVGCTTSVTQAMLNFAEPIAGRLDVDRIFDSGTGLPLSRFHHVPLLECEFAMRTALDIESDQIVSTRAEAESLIDAIAPAIELVDSRYAELLGHDGPSVLADNSMAAAVVLGPSTSWPPAAGPLELADVAVELRAGEQQLAAGVGSEVLGDPWRSLLWSLAHEQRRGRAVKAGTWIITGSCSGAPPAPLDHDIVADFGPLGSVGLYLETEGDSRD